MEVIQYVFREMNIYSLWNLVTSKKYFDEPLISHDKKQISSYFLTEVIFKYVVVMKPTKLGMWFELGFWDVYSEVLSAWHKLTRVYVHHIQKYQGYLFPLKWNIRVL